MLAFIGEAVFSGIIGLIQTALCIVSLLIINGKIKTKKSKIHKETAVIAFALILPFLVGIAISGGDSYEKVSWNDIVLNDIIPQLSAEHFEVINNDNENLNMYIHDQTSKNYSDYVIKCEQKGFSVDSIKEAKRFEAFNSTGYQLCLQYDASTQRIRIDLSAPEKFKEIVWSTKHLGKLIPQPKSLLGLIVCDDEHLFNVTIKGSDIDEYNEYIDECVSNGFNIDSEKTEKTYSAKNEDDYSVSAEYIGNGMYQICVREPEYNICVEVKSNENYMFSTYSINVFADNNEIGSVDNGENTKCNVVLTKGSHTLKFVNDEDDNVFGEVKVIISKDETLKFETNSYSDHIEINTISATLDIKFESLTFYGNDELEDITFDSLDYSENIDFDCKTNPDVENVQEYLNFVTENSKVATIEYNTDAYSPEIIITPTGYGETYVYIETTDKSMKTKKIKVVVEKEEIESYYEETTKDNSRIVYTTPYGEKYHYSKSCAGKNASETTINQVKGIYDPCKKCVG